jgi:hypothetical protein
MYARLAIFLHGSLAQPFSASLFASILLLSYPNGN